MDTEEYLHMPCWRLIHTHPRQEARAEYNLRSLNIETYIPLYKVQQYNRYTGKSTCITKPLFPRYIFARFKLHDLYHKVRFTRGVQGFVSFNDHVTTVDNDVVAMIQAREGKDGFIRIEDDLMPGDKVFIKEGPFKKIRAIFERNLSDADRVMLLLQTVSYQARIIVDRGLVVKAGQDGDICLQ